MLAFELPSAWSQGMMRKHCRLMDSTTMNHFNSRMASTTSPTVWKDVTSVRASGDAVVRSIEFVV